MDDAEAYRGLTAKASRYSGERTDLAGFPDGPLSVPDTGALGLDILRFEIGYEKHVFSNPTSLFREEVDHDLLETLKLYWDPVPAEGGKDYHCLVDRFLGKCLVELIHSRKSAFS